MISDGSEDMLVVLGRSDRVGGLSCFFVRAFIVSLAGEYAPTAEIILVRFQRIMFIFGY